MSKYVDEIIKDLKENPTEWRSKFGEVTKDQIKLLCFNFNPPILSVGSIKIKGEDIPTTYVDRYKMECAVRKWFKTVDLKTITS